MPFFVLLILVWDSIIKFFILLVYNKSVNHTELLINTLHNMCCYYYDGRPNICNELGKI